VATDSGLVLPAKIGSGIRKVRLLNRGTVMHEGVFEHFFTPDSRAAAFVESVRAGVDVPSIAEDAGGPGLAAPGDSTVVWVDLLPGHYAVGCWYGNHISHVGMQDSDVVAAGVHHVLVENVGTEEHEFDPYRLETRRHGPAPAVALGGSGTFPPGRRIWLPLTLTPGVTSPSARCPRRSGARRTTRWAWCASSR
jgi:hypothetical protein